MTRKLSVLLISTPEQRGDLAVERLAVSDGDAAIVREEYDDDGNVIVINGQYEDDAWHVDTRVQHLKRIPRELLQLLNAGATRRVEPEEPGQSLDELRELVAGLPGVVFRCGIHAGGKVDFMNDRIAEVCGREHRRFMHRDSRRLLSLVPPLERRQLLSNIARSERTGEPFSMEHRVRCVNGEERWVWHRGCVYRNRRSHAELEAFVVDITERKAEEQELAYLASHDVLTGVANRAMFMEQVGKSMQRADRHDEMVACLFLDLDRFKRVNDSFGHAFGDEFLQEVSARLKRCVRGNDLIGRLGGDEFAVLLDGIANPEDAATAAQKILVELQKPYDIDNRRFASSASIGISCYPGDATDRTTLLRNADAAMYSVKSSGRDGYRFFSSTMSTKAFTTLAISNALRNAIEKESVQLFYQPRMDFHSNKVGGLEVLARWETEEFGQVSPSRFIAFAEDVGLMDQLGELILRKACAQIVEWERAGTCAGRISLNLSPQQFRDDRLADRIRAVLDSTGVHPERLELEISEATLMQDAAGAAWRLRKLKESGITLSVGRFGTGYSSVQLLKKFPLDSLKMDRTLMHGVPEDKDQLIVVEATVAMAKRLGLRVVAEGIETAAQGTFARAAGCDEGQGYFYGRPVPASACAARAELNVH